MKMKSRIGVFFIVFGFVACGNKYPLLDNLPKVVTPWYVLAISFPFFEKKMSLGHRHSVYIYPDKTLSGSYDIEVNLRVFSDHLAEVVFDPKTENPFKSIFLDIYEEKYRKKYKDCDFTGFKFELDDNTATDEWYISFSADYCLYDEETLYLSTNNAHGWIVQRQASDTYRVLMEGYGLMYISAKHKRHGYQSIEQRVFTEYSTRKISLAALNSPERRGMKDPPCGAGWIRWEYKDNYYQPVHLRPISNSCSNQYEYNIEDKESFIARTQKTIKRRLLTWVSKVTGKPMDIDSNNMLVPKLVEGAVIK